jgi:hypothetical protein
MMSSMNLDPIVKVLLHEINLNKCILFSHWVKEPILDDNIADRWFDKSKQTAS